MLITYIKNESLTPVNTESIELSTQGNNYNINRHTNDA